MRICHIIPIYFPGIESGSSKYIQGISEVLNGRGHDVTVLTADAIEGRAWLLPFFGGYSTKKVEFMDGVRVKRLKTQWQITLPLYLINRVGRPFLPGPKRDLLSLLSVGPYLSNLEEELRNEKYDVVHVTTFPFGLVYLVWRACRRLNQPFVCTPFIHFEDRRYLNPILWEMLKEATAVFASSNYEREEMVRRGVDGSKIGVISMGINPKEWTDVNGSRFRQKYGLEGKTMVLFAGTKSNDKGAIHLLDAVKKVKDRVRDLVLVSIGWPTQEWKRKTRELNGTSLLDLGYVTEIEKRDAFDACDLLVMPSRGDAFGISYLEAWGRGKPVIGARVGAIPEILEENRGGLLVDFGDVDGLASALIGLLNDPDRRRTLGEWGRVKVNEVFNWERSVDRIEDVLGNVNA